MKTITLRDIPHLCDGIHRYERGLYVRVSGNSRFWLLKYSLNGKRREFGLGSVVGQSLSQVLNKAAKAKALIAEGKDPVGDREEKRLAARAKEESKKETEKKQAPRIKDILDDVMQNILFIRQFSGRVTERSWNNTFKHIRHDLGNRPVDKVTSEEVADFLREDWLNRPRTARDTHCRLHAVFEYCVRKGWRFDNPARWKGCLDALLPAPALVRRTKPVEHHAAVSAEELKRIAGRLWESNDCNSLCVLFGLLTVGRRDEYRLAVWSEIDLDEKTLSVPPQRRKDRKPENFIVPLSKQALAVLRRLDTSSKYVFVSQKTTGPVNDLSRYLKARTEEHITLHGTRSTFSDWCARNNKNFLVSEKCLMHSVGNQVFRAYQRDDLLDQRRELLQEWADYLLPNIV